MSFISPGREEWTLPGLFAKRKMNIIGIDPGYVNTAIVATSGSSYTVKIMKLQGQTKGARFKNLFDQVSDFVNKYSPDIVAVEGMAYGKFGGSNTIQLMAGVAAIIEMAVTMAGFPIIEIPALSWKSITMGRDLYRQKKGSKKEKAEYLGKIERRYKKRFSTTDAADAYLIAKAVQLVQSGQVEDAKITAKLRDCGFEINTLFTGV